MPSSTCSFVVVLPRRCFYRRREVVKRNTKWGRAGVRAGLRPLLLDAVVPGRSASRDAVAAPPGLREGLVVREAVCKQHFGRRERGGRGALRAFPFVHCASIETRKRLPARLKAAPRRAIAPASHGRCAHAKYTRRRCPLLERSAYSPSFVPPPSGGWHAFPSVRVRH